MFLVDTNIISTLAPPKTNEEELRDLRAWLDAASSDLYLSVVTAAEVQDGIAKLVREGATRKASRLEEWWSTVEHLYRERILPFDLDAAHATGRLLDLARGKGHTPDFADVAIAATARSHGLTILTANGRHFEPLEVPYINPFETMPPLG